MASHLHHEARRSSTDDIDAKNILEMNAAGNPQAAYEIFLTNEEAACRRPRLITYEEGRKMLCRR